MDTVYECDRQTDGQTDGQTDRITITKTVQRRASYGKNLISVIAFSNFYPLIGFFFVHEDSQIN